MSRGQRPPHVNNSSSLSLISSASKLPSFHIPSHFSHPSAIFSFFSTLLSVSFHIFFFFLPIYFTIIFHIYQLVTYAGIIKFQLNKKKNFFFGKELKVKVYVRIFILFKNQWKRINKIFMAHNLSAIQRSKLRATLTIWTPELSEHVDYPQLGVHFIKNHPTIFSTTPLLCSS